MILVTKTMASKGDWVEGRGEGRYTKWALGHWVNVLVEVQTAEAILDSWWRWSVS